MAERSAVIHVAGQHQGGPIAAAANDPDGVGSSGFDLLTDGNQVVPSKPVDHEPAQLPFLACRAGYPAESQSQLTYFIRVEGFQDALGRWNHGTFSPSLAGSRVLYG